MYYTYTYVCQIGTISYTNEQIHHDNHDSFTNNETNQIY